VNNWKRIRSIAGTVLGRSGKGGIAGWFLLGGTFIAISLLPELKVISEFLLIVGGALVTTATLELYKFFSDINDFVVKPIEDIKEEIGNYLRAFVVDPRHIDLELLSPEQIDALKTSILVAVLTKQYPSIPSDLLNGYVTACEDMTSKGLNGVITTSDISYHVYRPDEASGVFHRKRIDEKKFWAPPGVQNYYNWEIGMTITPNISVNEFKINGHNCMDQFSIQTQRDSDRDMGYVYKALIHPIKLPDGKSEVTLSYTYDKPIDDNFYSYICSKPTANLRHTFSFIGPEADLWKIKVFVFVPGIGKHRLFEGQYCISGELPNHVTIEFKDWVPVGAGYVMVYERMPGGGSTVDSGKATVKIRNFNPKGRRNG